MAKALNRVTKSRMAAQSARPVKDFWFTHGLQELSPEKFLKVVTKILKGEYVLLRFPNARRPDSLLDKRNGAPGIFETSDGRIK